MYRRVDVWACSTFGLRCSAFLLLVAEVLAGACFSTAVANDTISGSDGATITVSRADNNLVIQYHSPTSDVERTVFVAVGSHTEIGSAVIPFAEKQEGSTVFLPFKADRLFEFKTAGNSLDSSVREWQKWRWQEPRPAEGVEANVQGHDCTLRVPLSAIGSAKDIDLAIYSKEFISNSWGRFFGCNDPTVESGTGDRYIPTFLELDLSGNEKIATSRSRLGGTKLRIYQLFVRLFGNTNQTRKHNGTLAENGVGKFNDINGAALKSFHDAGFTHLVDRSIAASDSR